MLISLFIKRVKRGNDNIELYCCHQYIIPKEKKY
uniref:Uncharacterized protein n=1 Tax=Rhizophora mucronata TaxID=61149 RepID=A0A2P2MXD0_RHIMU